MTISIVFGWSVTKWMIDRNIIDGYGASWEAEGVTIVLIFKVTFKRMIETDEMFV